MAVMFLKVVIPEMKNAEKFIIDSCDDFGSKKKTAVKKVVGSFVVEAHYDEPNQIIELKLKKSF